MGLQFFNDSRRDMWGDLKSQVTFMFSQGVRFWDDIKMDCLLILAAIYYISAALKNYRHGSNALEVIKVNGEPNRRLKESAN